MGGVVGSQFYSGMWAALKHRTANMHTLIAFGIFRRLSLLGGGGGLPAVVSRARVAEDSGTMLLRRVEAAGGSWGWR